MNHCHTFPVTLSSVLIALLCGCAIAVRDEAGTSPQAGRWDIFPALQGNVYAATRSTSTKSVSLHVACGTGGGEKMIIIQGFSLKGVDPDILKKLNGTEIPLLISFDGRPPVKLNSTFALLPSLLDKDVGLGYQFVSLTPFLHRQLKEGQTLLIQNIGEARSYRFSLSGAEAAIGKLMCLL